VAESVAITVVIVTVTTAAGWMSVLGNYSSFLSHLTFIQPEVTSPSPLRYTEWSVEQISIASGKDLLAALRISCTYFGT
jgi:hypothetical protein